MTAQSALISKLAELGENPAMTKESLSSDMQEEIHALSQRQFTLSLNLHIGSPVLNQDDVLNA